MFAARAAASSAAAAGATRRRRQAEENSSASLPTIPDEDEPEAYNDCFHRFARRLPSWTILPGLSLLAVLILLVFMLPV
eukprot:365303-Chlamydomonas_euryale.AAC.50